MLRVFRFTVTLVLSGCLKYSVGVGTVGYQDYCDPDFEEDYYITRDPEFLGHKFLCNTEKNLECNVVENSTYLSAKSGNDSAENETKWSCGCKANTTFIEFGKARYWRKIIEEAQLLHLHLDVYDILNQSSLFQSKCGVGLDNICHSDESCPPNAICLPNQVGFAVCKCLDGYAPILDACYHVNNSSRNFCALKRDATRFSMMFSIYILQRYFVL